VNDLIAKDTLVLAFFFRNLALLLMLAILSACTTPAAQPTAQPVEAEVVAPGVPFTLGIGDEVVLEDGSIRLRFDAVIEDSRCPANAMCIDQGQAIIGLSATVGQSEPVPVRLTVDGTTPEAATSSIGAYHLTLRELNPYPGTTLEGQPIVPVATLVFER
jgi:hypothetical protein